MTIDRMRQEIKLRWNKINSNHKKDFPNAYLDDIINDAINCYVEIFYSGNNFKKFKLGFEVTQQRIDMLSSLVVPHKSLTATKVSDYVYKVVLNNISPVYRHFLRGHVTNPDCDNKMITIDLIRHNDFDKKIKDNNTKPSTMWNRCLGLIKSDNTNSALYLYTDFNPSTLSVEIEYLRRPIKVFSSGYDSLEYTQGDTTAYKTSDPKVHCDLPEDYHTLVVDIAVQLIAGMLEDSNKFAISDAKIQMNS